MKLGRSISLRKSAMEGGVEELGKKCFLGGWGKNWGGDVGLEDFFRVVSYWLARPIFWDETETENLDLLKFTTSPRKSWCWFFEQDETETRLSDFFMSETRLNCKFRARPRRDRESQCLFSMRPRREQTFKKKTVNLAKFCLKNTYPDQDETETRLRRDWDETETRLSEFFMSQTRLNSKFWASPRVSVSFSTRPRREPTFDKEKDCIFG